MNILLLRLSSMGDLIHTLPAIEDLSKYRPDVRLDWMCEAGFADIARLHPFVQQVIPMRWRHWRKHLLQVETRSEIMHLRNTLIGRDYRFCVDSQGLLKSAVFGKMAHAPILGYDKHSIREPLASVFYKQKYAVNKQADAIWRNRALFAQIFGYEFASEEVVFGAKVPAEVASPVAEQDYIVALHATSQDEKLWPETMWWALFEKLYEQTGQVIYLPWGNNQERERAEKWVEKFNYVKLSPKLNLLQAARLLEGAQSVIGVDTGLLHLANALNKPTVGIYLHSNPALTGVQESNISTNVGDVGSCPSVDTVFNAWQYCYAAKI